MTTIGNDLEVDGTITANQATQAGEAVVLGEDGLVPASLIASNNDGNCTKLPHFNGIKESSFTIGSLTSSSETGSTMARPIAKVEGIFIDKYGYVFTNLRSEWNNTGYAYKYSCNIKLSNYANELNSALSDLFATVRTNLRGRFKISVILTATTVYLTTAYIQVNITDNGIEFENPSWSSSYVSIHGSNSFGNVL